MFCLASQAGSSEHAAIQDALADLQEEPRELTNLYNDYASPFRQWSTALEMVALANYNDPVYIRQLWDVYLRQASLTCTDMTTFCNGCSGHKTLGTSTVGKLLTFLMLDYSMAVS